MEIDYHESSRKVSYSTIPKNFFGILLLDTEYLFLIRHREKPCFKTCDDTKIKGTVPQK